MYTCTQSYIPTDTHTHTHTHTYYTHTCTYTHVQIHTHAHTHMCKYTHMHIQTKGISLSCLQTCVVVSEERPRQALLTSFSTLLSPLGLPSSSVTASFSCRVNPLVALQVSCGSGDEGISLGTRTQSDVRVQWLGSVQSGCWVLLC